MSDQSDIAEFPKGNDLWLIKWIDEFRLPHRRTRSASVGVVLQQLAARDYTELDSPKATGLSHILGRKKDAANPVFKVPRVMVGSLPLLDIGQIYQNGTKIGQLPTSMASISIHQAAPIFGTEIEMGKEVPPPPWWTKGFPYRTLNPSEYIGLWGMPKSRCDVIRRRNGSHITEYLIPKTVIFKAFYGMHTEIAKAFCNGPWSTTYTDVICMHDFESGLKTQEVNDGKQWNIVLETLVQDAFAYPLALLYFDKHGRRCAEAIYTRSQQDRNGSADEPWYAGATIPYLPVHEPFQMKVKCLPLPTRTGIDDEDGTKYDIKRFLVTSIVGSSWPSHLPIIGRGRRNSGDRGDIQIVDSGRPPPFIKTNDDEKNGTKTTVDGTQDVNIDNPARPLRGDEWIWLNEPKSIKLKKDSSKKYEGERAVKTGSGTRVSTGEHTHEKDGLGKGEATTLVRAPEKRFEQIIQALEELKADKKDGFITSIQEIASPKSWQQHNRGGRPCWSFIAEETVGKKQGRSWRIVDYGPEDAKNIVHRCALVLELAIGGKLHYWIEIECRKNEGGFRSPLLSNLGSDYRDIIGAAIEIIALEKGQNVERELRLALSGDSIKIDSYKHHYPSSDHADLDHASVRRFLKGR
jgi:hypothetical protein